jgi:hypothetical protein
MESMNHGSNRNTMPKNYFRLWEQRISHTNNKVEENGTMTLINIKEMIS